MNSKWIKHNGTTCPVPKGTLIDVRYKNGDQFYGVAAGIKIETVSFFWLGSGSECDIDQYTSALRSLKWQG